MTERGYEPKPVRNGSITATKGDDMVRFVPLANHIAHIDTPTVTAMVREGTTDTETFGTIDEPTARPSGPGGTHAGSGPAGARDMSTIQ